MGVELDLCRPALERAIEVARGGLEETPPIEPPRVLSPFLAFRRLPNKALAAALRALDDAEFRDRVLRDCEGDESFVVDEASRLLLSRPEGWRDGLAALQVAAQQQGAPDAQRRAERDAARFGAQIDKLRRRLAETEAERNSATQRHDAAQVRIDVLQGALGDLEAQLSAAEAARQRAVRELKDTERRLAERTAEVKDLQAQLDASSSQRSDAETTSAQLAADRHDQEQRRDADRALIEALRVSWDGVGPALSDISRLLALPDQDPARLLRQAQTAARRATQDVEAEHRVPAPRNTAPRLPARIAVGSVEATRWLLSRPGVTVYVDGYNVTMLAWPELSAGEQRVALERRSRQLQAELGCLIVLVFDGDDEGGREVRSAVGSAIRVLFTARSVEADDEILEQLDAHPTLSIVISNDRRVQAGALERGAGVVRSDEFIALFR